MGLAAEKTGRELKEGPGEIHNNHPRKELEHQCHNTAPNQDPNNFMSNCYFHNDLDAVLST